MGRPTGGRFRLVRAPLSATLWPDRSPLCLSPLSHQTEPKDAIHPVAAIQFRPSLGVGIRSHRGLAQLGASVQSLRSFPIHDQARCIYTMASLLSPPNQSRCSESSFRSGCWAQPLNCPIHGVPLLFAASYATRPRSHLHYFFHLDFNYQPP